MREVCLVEVALGDYGKLYTFKTDIEGLKENDHVVCDTVNGMVLGKVVNMPPKTEYKGTLKWVIDKVDMDAHTERIVRETKAREIKRKLLEAKKHLEDRVMWEMLAEKSPEVRTLLDQLKEVEGE